MIAEIHVARILICKHADFVEFYVFLIVGEGFGLNVCLLCKKSINLDKFTCSPCDRILTSHRLPFIPKIVGTREGKALRVYSLFPYNALVRDLILEAKVANNIRALYFLASILCHDPDVLSLAKKHNGVFAVPSSAWGRIRGRFDIAGYVAKNLSREARIKFFSLPMRYFWYYQKRAKTSKKITVLSSVKNKSKKMTQSFVKNQNLLIDDIITTGYTVTKIKNQLPDSSLTVLTIASSLP